MIYKLQPILKHRLWGGKQLQKYFHVNTSDTIGEAWILSCINNDNCLVDNKKTLKQIFEKDRNIVKKGYQGEFPILIKLIDANRDLSIQVHPEIKTEFWHVLNKDTSKIFLGFKDDVSKNIVEEAMQKSTLLDLLNYVDVKNGDSYLIKPGTIHAICKNTFLIEIQQSADITYRLYDYNRVDSDGKKRPLHINESLTCIDYHKLEIVKNTAQEHLISTPYFNVYKINIKPIKEFVADDNSFNVITVIENNVVVKTEKQTIELNRYESCFIPASEGKYTIEGEGVVILTTL